MTVSSIRPASVADADAIAALHAASWRSAYRGIFRDSTLGPALDGERRAHWSGKLAEMVPDDTVLIADGVGFIAVWAKGDPGFGAHIDNLHVHPEQRSAGLGRRLLGEAMRRIAGRGETGAYLWVFDDNARAIDFYRRLGGEIVRAASTRSMASRFHIVASLGATPSGWPSDAALRSDEAHRHLIRQPKAGRSVSLTRRF